MCQFMLCNDCVYKFNKPFQKPNIFGFDNLKSGGAVGNNSTDMDMETLPIENLPQ